MSNAGRPRKPAALKLVTGTLRADRKNVQMPATLPIDRIPAPPKNLDAYEKAAWLRLAKIVQPMKIATTEDMVAFQEMVTSLAVCDAAREDIRANGITVEGFTDRGAPISRKNPAVEVLATFKRLLAAELARFGLTPADRERVSQLTGDAGSEDPLDEFSS